MKYRFVCFLTFLTMFGMPSTPKADVDSFDGVAPQWPPGLSRFCKQFLGICFKSCFKIQKKGRTHLSQAQFSQIARACRRACWNNPHRKKLCKMTSRQLIQQGDKLVSLLEREVKKERENILKLQLFNRKIHQKIMDRKLVLKKKQAVQKKKNQEEILRIRREKQQLLALRKELQQLKKAKDAKKQKQLKEEWKRIELQKKLLREEQQRLTLKKKLESQKKVKEELLHKKMRADLQKLEQIRKARLDELDKLKRQRALEKKHITELKTLAAKEKQIAEQRRLLEQQKYQALQQQQTSRVSKLRQKYSMLLKQLHSIRNRKKRIRQKRRIVRKKHKKRLRRIAKLRKRSSRMQKKHVQQQSRRAVKEAYLAFYIKGDLKSAVRFSHGKKRHRVRSFRASFSKGKRSHDSRKPNYALPLLERALTIDMGIAQGKGIFHPKVKNMLSDMYVLKGILASSRKNYSAAYLYFSRGKRHTPQKRVIVANLKRLYERGEKFFRLGLTFEKSNPRESRRYFRKALGCIHPKSPLAKKVAMYLK